MECFVVYRDEIEGRIDPFYYRPEFRELPKNFRFKTKKLGEIGRVFDGPFGSNLKNEEYTDKGIPLLRVQNIKDGHLNLSNLVYISKEKHDFLKRSEVKEGDVVITKTGWLGNASVVPQGITANIRADLAGVRIKDKKNINPEYLSIFIDSSIGKKLCLRLSSGSTRERIIVENLRKLEIPIPPLEIQDRIVQIMDNAYTIKKQKESEAKRLLDSINDYVLSELGIEIPELKEKMTFVVHADDVKGKRIDPYYYQPKFEEVVKAMEMGKYEVEELRNSFYGKLVKGTLPKEDEKNGEVKVLQIKNIHKNGLINISEYLTAKNIFKADQKLNKEELIIVITGATIGKVGLWNHDEEFYLGGDMVKFKVSKDFNPYYVQSFLLSDVGQYQILREMTGATNKHLSPSDVEAIKIPKPPLDVQNKIAEEVKRRIQKAEQLQREAKEVLEKAKQEVESIILNGTEE